MDGVTLGFHPVTGMAPLAVALGRGFYADEGFIVSLVSYPAWREVLDGVFSGELDGGMLLSAQPLAAAIGYTAEADIVVPYVMDRNGTAITVSNAVWAQMRLNLPLVDNGRPAHPVQADALRLVIENYRAQGRGFTMSMVSPVPAHNTSCATDLPRARSCRASTSPATIAGMFRPTCGSP
jgi:nitrate/nitrite transport system substrate-binding protein